MIKIAAMIKPDNSLSQKQALDRTLSVAPMMDWTDRHCRYFMRLLSPHALLYTEMVTTGALLHGDRARHLDFSDAEHPIALQLGGSNPADLVTCAKMATDWGYDEINLNCGCPSDRVQQGKFGACLMDEPELVADCVAAMRAVTPLPVTIKTRIGIDESEDYVYLEKFIRTVAGAGCDTFIIHARKAWLKGLSPKENRTVPPLRYDIAALIKQNFPQLTIILNGGIRTADDILSARTQGFDGVMVGRAAYETPYQLAVYEQALWSTALPDRADIARQMMDYIATRRVDDPTLPIAAVTRHILNLYHGERGGRAWRRILTEGAHQTGATTQIIEQALQQIPPCQRE